MANQIYNADIETALAVNLGFDFTPSVDDQKISDGQLHANSSWHHIRGPVARTVGVDVITTDELIGRIAFLIIDESGKLDPGALVTHAEPFVDWNANDAYDVADGEPFFDINGNGTHTNGAVPESNEVRTGASPQEITLTSDQFRSQVPNTPNGPAHWFSWRHLHKALNSTIPADLNVETLFPWSYDIEASTTNPWWTCRDHTYVRQSGAGTCPETGCGKLLVLVYGHRFDLLRPNWGSMTIGALAAPPTHFAIDATINQNNTGGIPWLAQLEATVDMNGDLIVNNLDHVILRNQVAANIIDFFDSDSTATSDHIPASGLWTASPPDRILADASYVGLERVPYLNEVKFSAVVTDAGAGNYQLAMTIDVEFVNIYSDASAAGTLELDVDYDGIPDVNGATHSITVPVIAGNSYGKASTTATFTYAAALIDLQVVDLAATYTIGVNLADFARITNDSGVHNDLGLGNSYASVQVTDPRANTKANWTWTGFQAADCGTMTGVTAGRNTGADPSSGSGGDLETLTTDPRIYLSTAFIRNGWPRSLWELGAIHRGEPWRTLNLLAYNSGADLAAIPATYAYGDALILDQVKLGPDTIVHGRVNINTPVSAVLTRLAGGITIGGTYNYTGAAGTGPGAGVALNSTNLNALAAAIRAANGTTAGSPFRSRSAVAPELAALVLVLGTTNRAQEELIGKLANLLTVRQNYFTVVVTAQAVQDLGTVAATGSDVVEYDTDAGAFCRILAEQKIMAIVYRDAFRNTFRIERYEFLHE